jgi:hypothetical protein
MEQTFIDIQRVPLLVDYPAARELLGGVSASTLARIVRRGEIPIVKVGDRAFVDRVDLAEFIQRSKTRRGGQSP